MDGWLDTESIRDILGLDYEVIKKRIQRGKFTQIRQVKVTGKGARNGKIWQIHITDPAIPEEARQKYLSIMASSLPTVINLECSGQLSAHSLPQPPAKIVKNDFLPELATLKKKQVSTMDARVFFMRLIERAVATGYKVSASIETIVKQAQNGELPPEATGLILLANARKGEERSLSASGMMKWWSAWLKSGKNPAALAPKEAERLSEKELAHWVRDYHPGSAARAILANGVPAWLPYFLDEYRRPQKPEMADARSKMRRKLPADVPYPSYSQVTRLVKKLPEIYLQKGRMTGAEYKTILGYTQRDASMFEPLAICQIDGHSFKAYVAHPVTGAHFHPEVCGVICLTTKILAGWSWGLAESSRTVADAYRHTCTVTEEKPWGGVPAIIEPDRGAGNMAKVNSDDFLGLFARVGTNFIPPETGGNPQGHGGIERSNKSIWIRAAKSLVTYTGKDMDRCVRKKIYTRLETDLKAAKNEGRVGTAKTSELLMSKDEFTEFLRSWVIEYNNTPHSALPKITDNNGKRRHMSPFEKWAECVREGWKPTLPPAEMMDYLFMPHVKITVKRCRFTLNGNLYHAYELTKWHGQDMIAAYDIHDANRVFVLDLEERLVCEAIWNGNRKHARPIPEVEQATLQREARQVKNLETKLDLVQAAARPAIEAAPAYIELPAHVIEGERRREQEREQKALSLAESRKLRDVTNPTEVYFMIKGRIKQGIATAYQLQWVADFELGGDKIKNLGLVKDDPYCFNDPEEKKEPEGENDGEFRRLGGMK